jgi:hypothetical protein
MKIFKIAQNKSLAYRICVLRNNPENPSIREVRPLFKMNSDYEWTPIKIGEPLMGTHYLGTKPRFCLAYYSGMTEIEEGETEVLLTLEVPSEEVPPPEEDAYMGGEIIVTDPIVIKIEDVETAQNKEEYAKTKVKILKISNGTVTTYPIAPISSWYGDADYIARGGKMITMSPEKYIASVNPLTLDEISRENIDILKEHILNGGVLDPLAIYNGGKEDGRHRAYAAKELGISSVPVIIFGDQLERFNENI